MVALLVVVAMSISFFDRGNLAVGHASVTLGVGPPPFAFFWTYSVSETRILAAVSRKTVLACEFSDRSGAPDRDRQWEPFCGALPVLEIG